MGWGYAVTSTLMAHLAGGPCSFPELFMHSLLNSGPGVKEGDGGLTEPQGQAPTALPSLSLSRQRALTGAVLVPSMAADGLHQEAVVGHGCLVPVPKRGEGPYVSPTPAPDQTPVSLVRGQQGHPGLQTLAWCTASVNLMK